MARYGNRYQLGLTLLTAFFMVATVFAILLYAFTPETPVTRGPLLLAAFIAILLGSLVCILLFLRWMLRPYRELVDEAEKASATKSSHKDEGEFVLETFQSVLAQLQEQRKALEELSAQAAQRADSAEKFSERIVASVPSGLIAFDGAGRSMVINAPGRALLDVDGAEVGQKAQDVLRNIPPLAHMVAGCLETGRIYRREEIEMHIAGQQPRRLGVTVAPIDLPPDEAGRGVLCLLTDITEVTNLREQVALKNNLESLGEMSAGLAHEFKNAIATLHGYVQLLQSAPLDDGARNTTSSLLNEVRNLSDMVTSFLNFARPQPLEFEEVNLAQLIEDCARELAPLSAGGHVELAINHQDETKTSIRADERMLRQALLNLIRNAVEAIPGPAAARRVDISTRWETEPGKSWAIVQVKDTGAGVPESDLTRIFIPFFTTKAEGHGVGLALAYRVITQHSGSLTAANSETGGALFTVRLPA
ncbi:MAG TPA: ATP-binding protein [Pyrinomonadaceae bacterium]|nr:ATP-binding protein [Pyrinomonadaceae bacterium]